MKTHPGCLDLALLELRLIARSRVTRYQMIVAPLIIAVITTGLVSLPGLPNTHELVFLASVFTPITYLALAVSWNAGHIQGLFGIPIAASVHITGRLVAAAMISAPVLVLLTIHSLLISPVLAFVPIVSVAFGVVVAGTPLMVVSTRYPRMMDVNASPLSDLGRFGPAQYVSTFAVLIVPWLASSAFTTSEFVVGLIVATLLFAPALPFAVRWAARHMLMQVPELCDSLTRKY